MGIKDMVQDGLGYVTPQDRADWDAREAAMKAEKEGRGIKAVLNTGIQSVLDYAEMSTKADMMQARRQQVDNRKKVRVITEKTKEVYDNDGAEMEL